LREECLSLARELSRHSSRLLEGCDCILLSGGIDTSFVAVSHPEPGSVTAITVDLGGDDVAYASRVAGALGMDHLVVRPSREVFVELVGEAAALLGSIDPVEASAGAVHVASSRAALRLGCRCLATGDGGDELFLGYGFLLRRDPGYLRRWIEEMASRAWLPTVYVAKSLGLEPVAPLYSEVAKRIALNAPLECLLGEPRVGKYMLRLYLEEAGLRDVAWRPKTPVTSGSGALSLLEAIASTWGPVDVDGWLGFKPPSKLHAVVAHLARKAGMTPPPTCTGKGSKCPVCGRCLNDRGYCRFCGAIVSGGKVLMHYSSGPPS